MRERISRKITGDRIYGKYQRKEQDILYVKDYCEPIIDEETWNATRIVLEKNKHSNYGEHIHLFTGIIRCPDCGKYYFLLTHTKIAKQKMRESTTM